MGPALVLLIVGCGGSSGGGGTGGAAGHPSGGSAGAAGSHLAGQGGGGVAGGAGQPAGGSAGGASGSAGGAAGAGGKGGAGGSAGGTAGAAGGTAGAAGGASGGAGKAAGGASGSAGGASGSAGGASGSAGGASGSAGGASGSAGAAGGNAGGQAGGGGAGGLACGDVGQACCSADGGNSCSASLVCLENTTCTCATKLFGRYLLRADGALLFESDSATTNQTPVLDANTGQLLANITDVADGASFGCAALSDGSVWCWRTAAAGNNVGQLGNGSTDTTGPLFRATRVLTGANQPLTGVSALADIDAYYGTAACAITAGGGLSCWGNTSYLLNNGTTLTSSYAVPVTTDGVTLLSGVTQAGIDGTIACVVAQGASAKEVWCWGANGSGELGTGDTSGRHYPTKVVGLTSPTKVVPFGYRGTTCALDGSNVRCWGWNGSGQVGNGTTSTSPVLAPTLVTLPGGTTALGGVVDLAGGTYGNTGNNPDVICALNGAHTALCWGYGVANPTAFAVTNVESLGSMDLDTIRVLTTDGVYHIGPNTPRAPNCGLLQ